MNRPIARFVAAAVVGGGMTAALAACNHQQSMAVAQPGAVAVAAQADGFGIFYNDQGQRASLAYGEANTDNVGLMLSCEKGAGRVQVSDSVRAAPAPSLILTSGARKSELLTRVENGEAGMPKMVLADTTTEADALRGFRQSGKISVRYGKIAYDVTADRAERADVELFFSVCGKPAVV